MFLVDIITTVVDHVWYEIWGNEADDGYVAYSCIFYDAEIDRPWLIAKNETEGGARVEARFHMARNGIA